MFDWHGGATHGAWRWPPAARSFFHSYSEILFLQSPLAGLLFCAATLTQPSVGIAGVVSVVASYLFARLIGMDRTFLSSGFFTYNALLVGLSLGYLFSLHPTSLFLEAAAGVLTFVVTLTLNNVFSTYLKLPILSLPFVLVSSVSYLAAYRFSNLYVASLHGHAPPAFLEALPAWLNHFFTALGAIFFLPQPLAGLWIALVVLFGSRILFGLALGGFLLGTGVSGLLSGSWALVLAENGNFNYPLIAMALGGVFLVPSPKSYLVAAIGVGCATLLLEATRTLWGFFGVPVFTLPFNMVTLSFLYALGLVAFPLVARSVRRTPEETLDDHLSRKARFRGSLRALRLPFSGPWRVWQGFDGAWTHRGALKYAYDFVIEKEGKTFGGDGARLEDYHAFGKPVLSPCRGRVARVVGHLPDNPPGQVDQAGAWGNVVVIDTTLGYWVALAHFAQNGLQVAEGAWVEAGTPLGRCGNSGYSPQPHIHVQVQAAEALGSQTLSFSFFGYLANGRFQANDLPGVDRTVEAALIDPALDQKTNFLLDQRFDFQTWIGQRRGETLRLDVGLVPGLGSCLASERGRLFFAKEGAGFYFFRLEGDDPWLALIFAALPSLPLTRAPGLHWRDHPPGAAVAGGAGALLRSLVRAVLPSHGAIVYTARWRSDDLIAGQVTGLDGRQRPVLVQLHSRVGFSHIEVGERRLTLIEPSPDEKTGPLAEKIGTASAPPAWGSGPAPMRHPE